MEDLDQPAQMLSLIIVFDGRSIDSGGFNVSSGGKLRQSFCLSKSQIFQSCWSISLVEPVLSRG